MQTPLSEIKTASLLERLSRHEIDAPPYYVSVYHETKDEFLDSIARSGLTPRSEFTNMGSPISSVNTLIDLYRPAHLLAAGVSRSTNIYAYPYLERGHGLMGADQRFIPQDEEMLRKVYAGLEARHPDYLRKIGAASIESYLQIATDPALLRTEYPGEILELKVDPRKCFVADLETFTDIQDGKLRGWIRDEDMEAEATKYWKNTIPLSEFFRWYKLPEYDANGDDIKDPKQYRDDARGISGSSFYPISGAPQDYPESIHLPEILIPETVPADHLRVLP